MALRDAGELGLRDPRRFTGLLTDDGSAGAVSPVAPPEPPPAELVVRERAPSRSTRASRPVEAPAGAERSDPASSADPVARRRASPLAGQQPAYLQLAVPGELLHRVELVAFEVGETRPRLAKHQLIVGSLVMRHVDFNDRARVRHLAELVDVWLGDPLSETVADRRLSARLPESLKRQVMGAALRLGQTHPEASAKTIVSALVNRYVRSRDDDPQAFVDLVELLADYDAQLRVRVRPA